MTAAVHLLLAAAAVVTALLACGSETPPEPTLSRVGCEVVAGGPPGPVPDPNGPYYHQVVAAHTSDGVTLSGGYQILDHASVPDGVRLGDNTVLVYYVNGADGGVFVARLLDDSAEVLGPIVLDGVTRPGRVVDPDAYLMPDGKVRLAYFSGFGPPGSTGPRAMCLAESEDGTHFTVLGAALPIAEGELLTDPSVVRLPDGSWRMAVSGGQRTVLARSADGLAFERYDTLTYGGVPELGLTRDVRLRLYVCAQGIVSYTSADGGASWQSEATVVAPGTGGKRIICDPSLVAGAGRFIYKTAN